MAMYSTVIVANLANNNKKLTKIKVLIAQTILMMIIIMIQAV